MASAKNQSLSINLVMNSAIKGAGFLQVSVNKLYKTSKTLEKITLLKSTKFPALNKNLKALDNSLQKIQVRTAKMSRQPLGMNVEKATSSLKEQYRIQRGIEKSTKQTAFYSRKNVENGKRRTKGFVKSKVKLAGGIAVGSAVGAMASLNPIRKAIDFESAMADVVKATDATENQRDQLKTNILKQLEKGSLLTGTQIAQIQAGGGRSGVALKALPRFTSDIAKASVALDLSTDESGTKFAKMAERLNLPISKINIMTNAFTHLENNGANFGRDMINTTGRLAGIFKELKFSPQNSAALSNYMNTLEVSPELAATSFKILTNRFKKTNSQFGYFSRLQKKGAGELKSIILDITKSMSKEDIMKTFGAQGANVITKMSGDLKNLDKSLKLVSGNEFMNAVDKEYSVKMNTTGAKETMAKNRIEGGSIVFGDNIKNQYVDFLNFLSRGVLKMATFYTENKTLIHTMGSLALKIAGVAVALKGITVIVGIGRVLGLLNPIGLAITAIAGAGYAIYTNWYFLKQKAGEIWTSIVEAIKNPFKTYFTWIETKFNNMIKLFNQVKSMLGFTDNTGKTKDPLNNKSSLQRQKVKGVGLALQTKAVNNVNFDPSKKVGMKLNKGFSLKDKLNLQTLPVQSPSAVSTAYIAKKQAQVTNNNMQQTHQTFNNTINVQAPNGEVNIHDLEAKLNQIQRASAHTEQDTTLTDVAS